jgi:hypothetical protein
VSILQVGIGHETTGRAVESRVLGHVDAVRRPSILSFLVLRQVQQGVSTGMPPLQPRRRGCVSCTENGVSATTGTPREDLMEIYAAIRVGSQAKSPT